VSFTIESGASTLSSVTATTKDNGVAEVTLTGGLSTGEKYESTIVKATLASNAGVSDEASLIVYATGAEVIQPDGDAASTECELAKNCSATATSSKGTTFLVTIQAGTVITVDGKAISLVGANLVVTPIVSPTNVAGMKTAVGRDGSVLFGVIIDLYYDDGTGKMVKVPAGTAFNPVIVMTITLGETPIPALTTSNTFALYLDETTNAWKTPGITVVSASGKTIVLNISHLTQFGGYVAAGSPAVYLPFISRVTSTTSGTLTF
jgi:hypothetical protein